VNQFDDQINDLDLTEDIDEKAAAPKWIARLLALILLLVFLLPMLLPVLQMTFHLLQPHIQPTPVFPNNLLHG
jgi:hypothetical protein